MKEKSYEAYNFYLGNRRKDKECVRERERMREIEWDQHPAYIEHQSAERT